MLRLEEGPKSQETQSIHDVYFCLASESQTFWLHVYKKDQLFSQAYEFEQWLGILLN